MMKILTDRRYDEMILRLENEARDKVCERDRLNRIEMSFYDLQRRVDVLEAALREKLAEVRNDV